MQKFRIQYLLARLTQHVDMAHKGKTSRGSLDDYFHLEIEHILPNKPEDDLRRSWQDRHPKLRYDKVKNRLGNLTLLEKPFNRALSNKSYSDKVSKYAKNGNYLTRSLVQLTNSGKNTSISRINKKLSAFEKSDAEDIEKRQSLLIALVHEVWKISKITL